MKSFLISNCSINSFYTCASYNLLLLRAKREKNVTIQCKTNHRKSQANSTIGKIGEIAFHKSAASDFGHLARLLHLRALLFSIQRMV